MRSPLKIALVEIHHAVRRMRTGDGGRFKNLVIQGDGQFLMAQTSTDEEMKLVSNNPCFRDGLPSQCVHQRFRSKLNLHNNECAVQFEVSEGICVNHGL